MSKKSNRGKGYFYALGQRDKRLGVCLHIAGRGKNWPDWAQWAHYSGWQGF